MASGWFAGLLKGGIVSILLIYPFLIYVAVSGGYIRMAGMVVAAAAILQVLASSRAHRRSVHTVAFQATGIIILAILSALFDTPVFILHLPVFISCFLLVTFCWSLRHPPCMIERYAMLFKQEFSEEEQSYLKKTTCLWMVFFIVNASITEVIILMGKLDWWALYAGLISYLIMGCLFAGEYIVRRVKFKEYHNHMLDRFIRWLSEGRHD